MSFALKPINPKIQRVLEEKSKILSRDTSALGTQGGMPNKLNEVQGRSSWIRWISGDIDPIVILGGVGINDNGVGYSLAKGFKEVYVPPDSATMKYSPSQSRSADGTLFKPLAGVKSITTSFEGATKALRKTVVTWTVFDLDELEVLTPHFLSPGKWTMLEVGWNYDGKTFKNLVGNKFFEVKDGKENAPAKPKTDKFEDLGSLDEIIYDNGGDYDVFSGIITNFEYSVRDDGGFDCTTTFTTHGISLLDAGKDTTTFTVDTAFEKIELTDDASLIGRLEQDNINIAMQKLATYFRVTITNKYNFLKSSMLLNRVGSQDPWPDGDFYGPTSNTNWFTYTGVKGKKIEEGAEFEGLKASRITDNKMEEDTPAASWVRWGWFEDNILSKYAGYASMTTNEAGEVTGINELKLKFRSIEDELISDPDAGTLGVKKVDENNKPIKKSVRILSHRNLITTDVNKFILIGKTPSLEKDTKGIYASLGKFLNNAPDGLKKYEFAVPKKDVPKKEVTEENTDETTVIPNEHEIEEGYIRNIFFNVRWLQEQFKGVGTLREVIDNIWNAFNAEYQNYWQFDVVGDINDTGIARITDINNSRYGVDKFKISDIKLKTPDPPTSYYGCYQFPTWTKDSIVSNMDYSVTIPTSQVAVAALSGGNLDANKIAQRNRGDIDVQTFVKSMHKSFEDRKERFFDNVTRIAEYSAVPRVAKFGNNSGDENASLSEGSGPNMINTLIKRDKDLVNAKIGETKVKAFKKGKIDDGQISLRSAHDFFKTPEAGKQTTNKTDWKVSLYNNGAIQSEGNSDYISVMLGIMHTSPTESKGALTDLLNGIAELKLTIDGTAGIFPGDAFTSMHLPNHLRPDISTGILPLLFQVTNVEQSISPDGWKTTISGQPRMNHKHVYNRTEAESGFEKLVKELKGTIVAGAVTSEALLTRLFENRNILGINRKYLNRFEMFMGITKILDDEYFDTISTTHSAGTPLMGWRKDTSVATDDGKLEWSTTTYTHQTSHVTNYSWEERCTPAMFSGRTIEEVMRFAMYNGILYAMPDEQTHNSTRDPYTSVDKTFQCVSYNLFKGDNPDTHRWKLNGKIPGYTTEYIEQMENDLNNFERLNETGYIGNTGIEGLYTPMAILRRGKDIMNKFLRSEGDTTSDPNWTKTKKYQQLFKFEKKSPITVDIDWWPDKEVQTYNLRINGDSYEIWFDYFKCMFDSYLGTDWEERAQLVKHPSTKDDTWKGDEDVKSRLNDRSDVERAHLIKLFDSENMFKYGVVKFSVENEIHKFLQHMTDFGFDFSPNLIWWKSLDSSDNNLDWFGVASKKDSFDGMWDKNYAHGDNGNASWQIYPYEDTDEGKQKITYVWYDKNADGTRGTKHKKKVN